MLPCVNALSQKAWGVSTLFSKIFERFETWPNPPNPLVLTSMPIISPGLPEPETVRTSACQSLASVTSTGDKPGSDLNTAYLIESQ